MSLESLQSQYRQLEAEKAILNQRYQDGDTSVLAQIQRVNLQIQSILRLITQEELGLGGVTISSGNEIQAAQTARDDGANTQLPEVNPGPFTPVYTNADKFTIDNDFGTNDAVRPAGDIQALPPSTAPWPVPDPDALPPPGSDPPDSDPPPYPDIFYQTGATPGEEPGAAASDDDAAGQQQPSVTQGVQTTTANNVTTLANKTARPITPKSNVLDGLASYTYTVSIYMMSPQEYRRLLTTNKKFVPGNQLLMQSGGAPQFVGSNTTDTVGTGNVLDIVTAPANARGRNQFFPLDYYIDDVQLNSVINGKGTGGAHNVTSMSFRIIEPGGITLLDNLYAAAQQYNSQLGAQNGAISNQNYGAQNYLMIIRFYGYDENGSLILNKQKYDPAGTTDSRAIVEKFIPFQFTEIKFKVANKLTEYYCQAVCPQNNVGTGQGRGVIPYNIELSATTVQNLFNGNVKWSATQGTQTDASRQIPGTTNTAPENANTAPDPSLATGLTQALNQYQGELVKNGTYEVADIYKIVISHPELANASIIPPLGNDLATKPMTQAQTAAENKDGAKQSVNTRAKKSSAVAGTSIVQFIDMAVRNSEYVYKQQTKIIDKDGKTIPQATGAQAFAWYRIGVETKPIKYDHKRNDYAYEITYEISPYGISDIKSEYFPRGRFRGAQKKYAYWFTGENTSVLNFEQDFNYLYYVTINTRTRQQVATRSTSQYEEIEKRAFAPNSPQSNKGIEGDFNEPAANAADYLYSPADQSRVRLTILGDPAWIQQGELWSGIRTTNNNNASKSDVFFDAFLDDGTINFDAREALFELVFNKPADYDINTGLVNVNGAAPQQKYVYKAITVVSNFKQGRFTQDLEGLLLMFPEGIGQALNATYSQLGLTSANDSLTSRNDENESAAETARLARQADSGSGAVLDPTVNANNQGQDSAASDGDNQTVGVPNSPIGETNSTDVGQINNYNDGIALDP